MGLNTIAITASDAKVSALRDAGANQVIEVFGSAHVVLSELIQVVDLVQRKLLSPQVAATMPIAEAAAAHKMLEARTAFGRIVPTHGR